MTDTMLELQPNNVTANSESKSKKSKGLFKK